MVKEKGEGRVYTWSLRGVGMQICRGGGRHEKAKIGYHRFAQARGKRGGGGG